MFAAMLKAIGPVPRKATSGAVFPNTESYAAGKSTVALLHALALAAEIKEPFFNGPRVTADTRRDRFRKTLCFNIRSIRGIARLVIWGFKLTFLF